MSGSSDLDLRLFLEIFLALLLLKSRLEDRLLPPKLSSPDPESLLDLERPLPAGVLLLDLEQLFPEPDLESGEDILVYLLAESR